MTQTPYSTPGYRSSGTSMWGAYLLGAVFVLAGFFVLGNVVLATLISAIVLGVVLLIAGISEVIQAFSAPHWRGLFLRLLIGVLYAVGGLMLIMDPLASSVLLTFAFGIALIASGIVRLFQAVQYWEWIGWLLLLSGIVGILAGAVILAKWPVSGLAVLGFLVGADLILHGVWWLALGWRMHHEPNLSRVEPS